MLTTQKQKNKKIVRMRVLEKPLESFQRKTRPVLLVLSSNQTVDKQLCVMIIFIQLVASDLRLIPTLTESTINHFFETIEQIHWHCRYCCNMQLCSVGQNFTLRESFYMLKYHYYNDKIFKNQKTLRTKRSF